MPSSTANAVLAAGPAVRAELIISGESDSLVLRHAEGVQFVIPAHCVASAQRPGGTCGRATEALRPGSQRGGRGGVG